MGKLGDTNESQVSRVYASYNVIGLTHEFLSGWWTLGIAT